VPLMVWLTEMLCWLAITVSTMCAAGLREGRCEDESLQAVRIIRLHNRHKNCVEIESVDDLKSMPLIRVINLH